MYQPEKTGHQSAWYVVNGITLYRVLAVPLLLWLLYTGRTEFFTWAIAVSFFTDAVDGILARLFRVTSVAGARLDSVGDDLTVAVGLLALIAWYPEFMRRELPFLLLLAVLFFAQTAFAFYRYRRMSNFHTWLAKAAAVLQGIFMLYTFFSGQPEPVLFFVAVAVTALELAEEIWLVALLPEWKANVHGIFHAFQLRQQKSTNEEKGSG